MLVGGKKFKVHKGILAIRSPVFAAMFDHDTKEKQENLIEIPDIKPEVLQALLEHIYTGKVPSMDQYAEELLAAADKVRFTTKIF